VSKRGDIVTGDLLLSIGSEHHCELGCRDLNANAGFSLLLGDENLQMKGRLNHPILLETTHGFLVRQGAHDIIRFGMSSDNRKIFAHEEINMNKHSVTNLHEPRNALDATTKSYVDSAVATTAVSKKNLVGYIPLLEANTSKTGFVARGSTTQSNGHQAFGAFNNLNRDGNNGSWVTAANAVTGWLQIKCPERTRIWRVALKAREFPGRNITGWNLSASNDEASFTPLIQGSASMPSYFEVIPGQKVPW
jgi:hypothetical protein